MKAASSEVKPLSQWIVGPGAMGRLIGLRLSRLTPVTLIGRRRLANEQTLVTPEGAVCTRRLATASLATLPAQPPAMVHLTTKAYAAQAAHTALASSLPTGTPLVLWQNGYAVQPMLTQRHPGPVLCATTTEGAYVEDDASGDSRVIHAGHGETFIGALDGGHAELAGALARWLTANGLPAEPVGDIRVRLWRKLAINAAINPLAAHYRIRNGQLRDRPFRPLVEALIEEIAAIMRCEGIAPPPSGWAALIWRVVEGTATNRASMLQDVLAGRPTERAAILGPLLAAAQRHALAVPRLADLDRHLSHHD